jgi:hypothetical protein
MPIIDSITKWENRLYRAKNKLAKKAGDPIQLKKEINHCVHFLNILWEIEALNEQANATKN